MFFQNVHFQGPIRIDWACYGMFLICQKPTLREPFFLFEIAVQFGHFWCSSVPNALQCFSLLYIIFLSSACLNTGHKPKSYLGPKRSSFGGSFFLKLVWKLLKSHKQDLMKYNISPAIEQILERLWSYYFWSYSE